VKLFWDLSIWLRKETLIIFHLLNLLVSSMLTVCVKIFLHLLVEEMHLHICHSQYLLMQMQWTLWLNSNSHSKTWCLLQARLLSNHLHLITTTTITISITLLLLPIMVMEVWAVSNLLSNRLTFLHRIWTTKASLLSILLKSKMMLMLLKDNKCQKTSLHMILKTNLLPIMMLMTSRPDLMPLRTSEFSGTDQQNLNLYF